MNILESHPGRLCPADDDDGRKGKYILHFKESIDEIYGVESHQKQAGKASTSLQNESIDVNIAGKACQRLQGTSGKEQANSRPQDL